MRGKGMQHSIHEALQNCAWSNLYRICSAYTDSVLYKFMHGQFYTKHIVKCNLLTSLEEVIKNSVIASIFA